MSGEEFGIGIASAFRAGGLAFFLLSESYFLWWV